MTHLLRTTWALALMAAALVSGEGSAERWWMTVNQSSATYHCGVGDTLWIDGGSGVGGIRGRNGSWIPFGEVVRWGQWEGNDSLGHFRLTSFVFLPEGTAVNLTYRVYDSYAVLGVSFPDGYSNPVPGNVYTLATAFPSVSMAPIPRGGNTTVGYTQLWHTFLFRDTIAPWTSSAAPRTGPDAGGGPIVLWDRAMQHTIVVSPLDTFMLANTVAEHGYLSFGVMGTVETLPKGFAHHTLIYYYPGGVRRALFAWGGLLQKYYRRPSLRNLDPTLSTLGYSTDHGAYYYYRTEPNMTYEGTLVAVREYLDRINVPVQYALLDSWWYQQGPDHGTTNWTPTAAVFPSGLDMLSERLRWKFQLHNRYWSNKVVYARQNGGEYPFVLEGDKGAPLGDAFWEDLVRNKSSMVVYEQDWLYAEWMGMNKAMLASPTLPTAWLHSMGRAALAAGVAIQYCMAWPRFAMAALEIPSVTQIRVSNDYVDDNQWMIGISSLLPAALGLAPSKDSFRTTVHQPDRVEPLVFLQAAVASLSAGPVAISDAINHTDRAVVMMAAMANGTLLSPDVPATAIDQQHVESAFLSPTAPFSTGGVVLLASSTPTGDVPCGGWHYILSSGFREQYAFDIASAPLAPQSSSCRWAVATVRRPSPPATYSVYTYNTTTLTIPLCSPDRTCNHTATPVFIAAPLLPSGWAYLGELSKWVSASSRRITRVKSNNTHTLFQLAGGDRELLTITLGHPCGTTDVAVALDDSGEGSLTVPPPHFKHPCE
eukprot:Sspe_Gene.70699::Locus_41769_Transcript_1_1_Confidence_1.000_Length_2353::g.70699::m.70699